MSEQRISLAPEDQVQGASFFDDVDIEVADIGTRLFTYKKKDGTVMAANVPALVVKYRPLVEGGEQHEFEEVYSGGDASRVQPAEDGDGFVPAPGKTFEDIKGMGENSRAGQYLGELVRAGYPAANLKNGRVKQITGLKAHVLKIDPPKKSDKDKNKILVVTKIISLPDAKAQASGGNAEAAALAVKVITAVLKKSEGKPVTMTQLSGSANKALAGKPNQLAVVSLLLDSKFLATEQGWSFNGREVSPAAVEAELAVEV